MRKFGNPGSMWRITSQQTVLDHERQRRLQRRLVAYGLDLLVPALDPLLEPHEA